MRKYIITGAQGSGKGTQSRLLADDYDLVHISVGDIFRWHIKHHTKTGARVKRIVAAGQLVPDDMVEEVVRDRLALHDWNYGFILDGFPRNPVQARFFLESYDIDAVIVIEVPEELVVKRVLSRRLCSVCGLDYNLIYHRPAVADTCDVCRGRLVQRDDDTVGALQERLRDFREKTEPILDLFEAKECVVRVDGTRSADAVQREIRDRLRLGERAPASSSGT